MELLMSEENEHKTKYLSDEVKNAKNKVLYFSLAVLIITIFEPSLTGFLGNFSIKVKQYPNLFLGLLYLSLLWILVRYMLLLFAEYKEIDFTFNLKRLVLNIGATWHNETRELKILEEKVEQDIEQLETKGITKPKKYLRKLHQEGEAYISIPSTNSTELITRQSKTYRAYLRQKNRLSNLKTLVLMDVFFPFLIWLLAMASLAINHQELAETILKTNSADHQEESQKPEGQKIKILQEQ